MLEALRSCFSKYFPENKAGSTLSEDKFASEFFRVLQVD